MYHVVTGVTSDVGVQSTYLVKQEFYKKKFQQFNFEQLIVSC